MDPTPSPTPILNWLEDHRTAVDLAKWVLLLLAAWLGGVFRFFGRYTRRPRLKIKPIISRCFIEEFDEFNGRTDCARVAFLVDVWVINRSSEKIVIEDFRCSYVTNRFWLRWSRNLHPATLPNQPRVTMGGAAKLMPVWFSHFQEGPSHLTVEASIEPKEACGGYLLFVSFTYGSWNPRTSSKGLRLRVTGRFTTGARATSVAWIPKMQDKEKFEHLVPGIFDQLAHESSWNIFAD